MDYIGLALAVFKLLNWILDQVSREQIKRDVRNELLVEQMHALSERTDYAKDLREKISKLNSEETDAALRDLEPKS